MKKSHWYLVFAAFSYASMSALIKALSASFEPFWQAFLYMMLSLVIVLAMAVWQHKPLRLKHARDYAVMVPMGVLGFGMQVLLFTTSLYHNTIGNSLFVFSCYPIVAAVLAHYFLGERINKRLRVALVLLCCMLFLLFDPSDTTRYLLGNTYALLACVLNAGYIIGVRVLTKRGNAPETITLWSMGLAVMTSGAGALMFQAAPVAANFTAQSVLYLVLFGILNSLAWHFANKGFAKVRAGIGSLILLLEPIIGSLLGLLLFHEVPATTFLVGAVIMVTSIYVATFRLD